MPESVNPSRDNSKAALAARLEKYESVSPQEREEISDLPRWVKTALVLQAVDGLTHKDAAARFNRTGKTLAKYASSPAAKKWLGSLTEFIEDPVAMAKAYLSANALSVTLERFIFLQAAIDAGDYKVGDQIARDLQDRMGVVAKREKQETSTIILNLGSASLEIPLGHSEAVIQEGDFEIESKD